MCGASCTPPKAMTTQEDTSMQNASYPGAIYYLAAHVSACMSEQGAVLLDLRRNRYYGLPLEDALSLAPMIEGWPESHAEARREKSNDRSATDDLIRSLLQAGILQTSPIRSPRIGTSTLLDGDLCSVGDEIISPTTVRFAHVICFVLSLMSALCFLRILPLSVTVRVVHGRKSRAIARGYRFDPHRAEALTFVFRRLRPYFFTANGHCMLHALALVNFLALHGEFPCWVLGVRSQPWGAHSWVQYADLLFDTNPTKVCAYDPILSV